MLLVHIRSTFCIIARYWTVHGDLKSHENRYACILQFRRPLQIIIRYVPTRDRFVGHVLHSNDTLSQEIPMYGIMLC